MISISSNEISLEDEDFGRFCYDYPNTEILFTPALTGSSLGTGTLKVGEKFLFWHHPDSGLNVKIDYRDILIHAFSRGDSDIVTRRPCLYLQLDSQSAKDAQDLNSLSPLQSTTQDANGPREGSDDEKDETDEEVYELRIVPSTGDSQLEDIFLALSECSALHPDPAADQDSEDDASTMLEGTGYPWARGDNSTEGGTIQTAALEDDGTPEKKRKIDAENPTLDR